MRAFSMTKCCHRLLTINLFSQKQNTLTAHLLAPFQTGLFSWKNQLKMDGFPVDWKKKKKQGVGGRKRLSSTDRKPLTSHKLINMYVRASTVKQKDLATTQGKAWTWRPVTLNIFRVQRLAAHPPAQTPSYPVFFLFSSSSLLQFEVPSTTSQGLFWRWPIIPLNIF